MAERTTDPCPADAEEFHTAPTGTIGHPVQVLFWRPAGATDWTPVAYAAGDGIWRAHQGHEDKLERAQRAASITEHPGRVLLPLRKAAT